jgi:hypothetical protein
MIAFSTMLKGPALDFFYANKIKGYKKIEQICESIKNYFGGQGAQNRAIVEMELTYLEERHRGEPR